MTSRIASCSCGQLRAEVSAEPIRVTVCDCHACQRRTGSVFGVQARFARAAVRIEGTGTEFLRVGDEGGRVRFTFCPHCGATVFYRDDGNDEHIAIPVGAFADASIPEPALSIYEERMHPWVVMPQGIAHMA